MYDENYKVNFTREELISQKELMLMKQVEDLKKENEELRNEIEKLKLSCAAIQ